MDDPKMRKQEIIALKIVHILLREGYAELRAEHCEGGGSLLARGQADPAEVDTGVPTIKEGTEQIAARPGDAAIQTACWAFGEAARQRVWQIMRRTKAGREIPDAAIDDLSYHVSWAGGADPVTGQSIGDRLFKQYQRAQ